MAKAKIVKTPVVNKVPVETVVIDDEETNAPSPVNEDVVHPEFISDLAGESHPVTDKDMPENPSFPVDVHSVKP